MTGLNIEELTDKTRNYERNPQKIFSVKSLTGKLPSALSFKEFTKKSADILLKIINFKAV